MIFYIDNKEKKFDNGFVLFVIYNMRLEFGAQIDRDQARQWDEYLNDEEVSKLDFSKKQVKAYDILYLGISRLVFRKYKDVYLIEIRPYETIPGTRESLSKVCNLINYGTADMTPYPIFTKVFNTIEKKLNKLYRLYYGG